MADPAEVIAAFRRLLAAGDAGEAAFLSQAFRYARTAAEAKVRDLEGLIALKARYGEDPAFAQLLQRKAEQLAEQVSDATARLYEAVDEKVRAEWGPAQAIQGARAADAILAVYGIEPAVRFDPERVIAVSATLSNSGPFQHRYAASDRMALKRILVEAVTLGTNPRAIAPLIENALGISQTRALTTARTETLRAARSAALARYNDSAAVDAWIWISARDTRTCAFCWAMHGEILPLTEPMRTHPNCRCSEAPRPADDQQFTPPVKGSVLFERLTDDRQLAILGPKAWDLYRRGVVNLDDFAGFRTHPIWGGVGYRRSLREILEGGTPAQYARALDFAPDATAALAGIRDQFPDFDTWLTAYAQAHKLRRITMTEIAEVYNARAIYSPATLDPRAREIAHLLGLKVDPIDMTRPEWGTYLTPGGADIRAIDAWLQAHPQLSAGGFTSAIADLEPVLRLLTAQELSALATRYPGVARWIAGIGTYDGTARPNEWAHYGVKHWPNQGPGYPAGRIEWSTTWTKRYDDLIEGTRRASLPGSNAPGDPRGFHGPGTGPADIVVHEFGHAVMDRLGYQKTFKALAAKFAELQGTGRLPTGYAEKDPAEAWAEAFVEIWNGRTSNEWVAYVRDILIENDVALLE